MIPRIFKITTDQIWLLIALKLTNEGRWTYERYMVQKLELGKIFTLFGHFSSLWVHGSMVIVAESNIFHSILPWNIFFTDFRVICHYQIIYLLYWTPIHAFFCFCRTPSCHQASNTLVLGPIKMMINNMLRTYGRLVGDFLLCRSLTRLILWLSGPGALRYQDNCKNGIGCAGRSVIFFLWYGFTKLQSSKCN